MKYFLFLLLAGVISAHAQSSSLAFTSLDDVFSYAGGHSSTFRNASQQSLLTRYETIAAKYAEFNFKGNASVSSLINTQLPVTFLPAQIFGGPAGTYREITLGQKYNNTAALTPQIDLLNPYLAARVRMARANELLTKENNLISQRDLYQSIAAAYCNILSYQRQIKVTEDILANSDSVTIMLTNKQKEGIARQQDVSSALASELSVQDKLQQLQVMLAQQTDALKILCDIDPSVTVSVPAPQPPPAFEAGLTAIDYLQQQQALYQLKYQQALLRADKKWYYPTLTLFGNVTWEQFSNTTLYGNSEWYPINYISLQLSLPILPDINKIAAVRYDRINSQIAATNASHAALQDSLTNHQSELDYQKAYKSYELCIQIAGLKEDVYRKNLNIYNAGILSATDLFTSFTDWLNNSLNEQAQLANSEYARAKILITHIVQ